MFRAPVHCLICSAEEFCAFFSRSICLLLQQCVNECIVCPAEILLGAVYIWGNPQLCYPDPENIVWRDMLDKPNTYADRHRLQGPAPNCEQLTD